MFYAVYTTKQQLAIFSTKLTQCIKSGLQLENVCLLTGNSKCQKLALLTLKGQVQLYKVRDIQALDSCVLEVQASIVDVLKIRNSQQQQSIMPVESESVVYVEKLVVCDDCTLIINLTDGTRHEYVVNAKLWREISSIVELPEP